MKAPEALEPRPLLPAPRVGGLRARARLLAALSLLVLAAAVAAYLYVRVAPRASAAFTEIAPGLTYADLAVDGGARAHVFRADLSRWRPIVADARKDGRTRATASELARESGAAVVVNGSFFDVDDAPLGLLISRGAQLNPLRKGADWGVFMARGERLSLAHTREVADTAGLDFAIQCGPRIVIDGEIPKLKPQSFPRTALGVTRDGAMVLLATYGDPVAADDLGRFLAKRLNVRDALLMDGGPSTQLYANVGDFEIDREGGTPVANGVGLVPR
jgi:hypothetical protein